MWSVGPSKPRPSKPVTNWEKLWPPIPVASELESWPAQLAGGLAAAEAEEAGTARTTTAPAAATYTFQRLILFPLLLLRSPEIEPVGELVALATNIYSR
jgi:hypothetical protein